MRKGRGVRLEGFGVFFPSDVGFLGCDKGVCWSSLEWRMPTRMPNLAAEPHPGGGHLSWLSGCVHPEGPGGVEVVSHGLALLPQPLEGFDRGLSQPIGLWVVDAGLPVDDPVL